MVYSNIVDRFTAANVVVSVMPASPARQHNESRLEKKLKIGTIARFIILRREEKLVVEQMKQ